jgi:hypothetical protein
MLSDSLIRRQLRAGSANWERDAQMRMIGDRRSALSLSLYKPRIYLSLGQSTGQDEPRCGVGIGPRSHFEAVVFAQRSRYGLCWCFRRGKEAQQRLSRFLRNSGTCCIEWFALLSPRLSLSAAPCVVDSDSDSIILCQRWNNNG